MTTWRTTAAIFLVVLGAPALAADGQDLYMANACHTCHGPTGNEPILPTYPKIGGQNRGYLVRQLQDIKSGERNNGQAIVMRGLMTNLSDDDIAAIADYLSKL